MSAITFHSIADSAYLWAVMHVADEKGAPYTVTPLAYRSPEHLALHPFGKMPIMQHGDFVLYESLAIAHYIDRAFEGPPLQPPGPRAQAIALRWVSVINAYVFPIMNRFMKERLVRPAWGVEPDHAFIESARDALILQMETIETALADGAYLAGETLTIADSFLLPQLLFFALTPEGEALMAQAPRTKAWLARMMARASYVGGAMSRAYDAIGQLPKPTKLAWPIT